MYAGHVKLLCGKGDNIMILKMIVFILPLFLVGCGNENTPYEPTPTNPTVLHKQA